MGSYIKVKSTEQEDISMIALKGDIDLYSAQKLKQYFVIAREKEIKKFIFNFDEVEYIDSSGIGVLMYIFGESKRSNILVYFSNIHGMVRRVIELTKLVTFFPIVENDGIAIKLLQQGVSYHR